MPLPGTESAEALIPGFRPETELERTVSEQPELLAGLAWGEPRRSHPEGRVGAHVADLLDTLERWGEPEPRRRDLRFVALVHDSFKYAVSPWMLRRGENHHAMRARRFAERFTDDERLLVTIELHDRPYYLWRRRRLAPWETRRGLEVVRRRVADRELFARFVELDGSSEGKNPAPVEWLREML